MHKPVIAGLVGQRVRPKVGLPKSRALRGMRRLHLGGRNVAINAETTRVGVAIGDRIFVETGMTGSDFRAAVLATGLTMTEFAGEMGVHRSVLSRQCGKKTVEQRWVYALAGLVAIRSAETLIMLKP